MVGGGGGGGGEREREGERVNHQLYYKWWRSQLLYMMAQILLVL